MTNESTQSKQRCDFARQAWPETPTTLVYIVRFVSRSGGHSGYTMYETRDGALAAMRERRAKGFRVTLTKETRS